MSPLIHVVRLQRRGRYGELADVEEGNEENDGSESEAEAEEDERITISEVQHFKAGVAATREQREGQKSSRQ